MEPVVPSEEPLGRALERVARSGRVTRADLACLDGQVDWRALERGVSAELRRSARAGGRMVRAFSRLADACGSREARGRAARLRASSLAFRSRFEESLPEYREAVDLLRGAARDGARIGLAGSELRLGRFETARNVLRGVRRSAGRRGDTAMVAGADLNEATAWHEDGRPERALRLYARARDGFEKAGNVYLAGAAVQNRANALVLLDRHTEAATAYRDAAAKFDCLGLTNQAARCRYNQGALLVATDRLGEADEILADAERVLDVDGDGVLAALCRLDRGEALLRAGLAPEAVHAIRSARIRMGRRAAPVERARATLLLARARIALGQGPAARRLLRSPLPVDSTFLTAWRHELRGRASASCGDDVSARGFLETAAAGYGRTRPAARGRALTAAAWCAWCEGDVGGARRLILRAERAVAAVPLPSLEFGVAAVRFLLDAGSGRRSVADARLARAMDALERIRDGLGPDAMRAAILRGREAWLARAVTHVLEGPDGAVRALELVERWRARALVDLLGDAARLASTDERLAALRAQVAALERRVEGAVEPAFLRGGAGTAPAGLVRRLAAAERRLDRYVDRAFPAARAGPPDLARVRAGLGAGGVALVYFSDGSGAGVFVVDRHDVKVVRIGVSAERIETLVRRLHFQLGQFTVGGDFATRHRDRLLRETDSVLADLARRTLDPVAAAVGSASQLVIVPHGPWHRVPFAALPFRNRRLVDHATLWLTPSLGALRPIRARARGAPVVVGYHDALAPTIQAEVDAVASVLPRSRVLTGVDARFDALGGRSAPSLLHVASHGRFRADSPAMSGVRLADGWLRAADFRTLDLRGSLVVLSGCETGVSSVDAGDELHGLVRGVLASGARHLVASLWRVDDPATADLMAAFHAHRRSGVSPAAALGRAQSQMAGRGMHPWYWAGFGTWTATLPPAVRKLPAGGVSSRGRSGPVV